MTLTVALALFGAAVLAAMAAHLWWQARRAQPRRVLAPRSETQREPVLIWVAVVATAISEIVVSSVSPERCETIAA